MASKKPSEPSSLFGNIKIKEEPGTSSASSSSQMNNIVGTGRLKSFVHNRDLNLITVKTEKPTRKTVGPNVANYQRKKKEDVVVKQEPIKVRKERKAPVERVRGRGKNQTVSLGVATEASSLSESRRSSNRGGGGGSGGDRESRASIIKPTVDIKQAINTKADEEVLKSIYKDDFIDDGDDGYAGDSPYTLPVISKAQLEVKTDPNLTDKDVAIKKENKVDEKPVISENGHVESKKLLKNKPLEKKKVVEDLPAINPASLFENNSEKQLNEYLLIELPDCMPGFKKDDDDENFSKDSKNLKKESEKSSAENDDNSKKNDYCKLNSLKEGLIGKIQIHKSGKAYLKVGNNTLHIDIALKRCFRQDLIAAKLENNKNNLINLGSISNTLNCTPSWESMLANV
ncbi:hypothetical protein HCN44_002774 [Aphidius gifuensis]|uniref:DNA-directed RNA polymerase III subunit RPC4 n=1 Tax=Aphidius gifuensis TaxID=684658 RepID=A0A834XRI6_APHGI|nr:uncharacterized protein LOC122854393 [Aphidius gifuensis]KAF7991212.1 hypothetical protein HCN44_002774 [Aphidius gifuensis]